MLSVTKMVVTKTLRAASGWLELGLADEALYELQALPTEVQMLRGPLELKLAAQMERGQWNPASETARLLCLKAEDVPEFFLRAAYCLHELGQTQEALDLLARGPAVLRTKPVYYYNVGCYLACLGENDQALKLLEQSFEMDGSLRRHARKDPDLDGLRQKLEKI